MFFHGGFSGAGMARVFEKVFSERGYQIIAPYLPGHGPSFRIPRGFSYADLVKVMADFVEVMGLEKTVAMGHSLGGRLTWDLRDKFRATVIISPMLLPMRKNIVQAAMGLTYDYLSDVGFNYRRKMSNVWRNLTQIMEIWGMIKSAPAAELEKGRARVLMCIGRADHVLEYPEVKEVELDVSECGHYVFLGRDQGLVTEKILGFVSKMT